MMKSISIIAAAMAAAPAVTMASPLTVQMDVELQNRQQNEKQQRQRGLKSGKGSSSSSSSSSHDGGWQNGWHGGGAWPNTPDSSSSSSSSGKSGKSGGGSGKSGKSGSSSSSTSVDGWENSKPGLWGPPPGWWAKPDDSSSSTSSGKSGKSGGSKSGKGSKGSSSSSSSSHDGWSGSPPGWGSGGGSWVNGDHHSPWDHDGWYGDAWSGSSSSSSGKSGKSGGGSGSGKSGKSGSSSSSDDHSHGHWHWAPKPWKPNSSSSSSSKSGKSKSGKSKTSKHSKGSSSSTSPDGHFVYHVHEHDHSTTEKSAKPPGSSSPGICAPAFDEGGLECDVDEWSYCTKPGSQAECGAGHTCYDKELCPEFSTKHPIGMCDAHGKGLDCDEVTTYCTEPGDHGECGSGSNCYDAGLCGYGDGEYDGVCGMAFFGGKNTGLDCSKVTTKCTEPGEHAECAYGAKCFDAALCNGGDHAGFCSSEHGFDCEDVSTHCAHPGEGGQCSHGQKCYDTKVCYPTVTSRPTKATIKSPTPSPTVLALKEVCFHKGTIIDCDEWESTWGTDAWGSDGHTSKSDDDKAGAAWGSDGHGSESGDDDDDNAAWFGDGHGVSDGKGEAISVPFTYTVDTNGKVQPDSVVKPLENAILDDVVEYIEDNEEYSHFSGKISADPLDEIADDDWCGDGHAVRCSVVKGEMSIHPGWGDDGDGHQGLEICDALDIIRESMDGNDYTEVDGVTSAKYRNGDHKCGEPRIIAGAAIMVQPQEDDSFAALGFLLFVVAALIALALLVARKFRRKPPSPEPVREDISLISNNLNGSLYEEPNDPYANTIDVHKCTSIYCNCNGGGNGTTFLPAPNTVDMAKTMTANGVSPTAVNEVDGEFFNQDDIDKDRENQEENEAELEQAPDLEHQSSQGSKESQGSIMRVPISSQFQESARPLTPVDEIAHDSEIDTEMESLAGVDTEMESYAGENDETTVPPPPPLAFHPAYRQGSGEVQMTESSDEISI